MSFFNVIKHLLPRSNSWNLTIDKTLRKWFQGIAEWPQDVKDFVDLVWLDAFPETTRELSAWEKQFGLQTVKTIPLFTAVSIDGTSRVMTSPYGETWTARSAAGANSWRSICYSNKLKLFCAVASDGTNRVMTSPDGETWTARSAAEDNFWIAVTFSESLCLFCAVASDGTNRVMTSPDGATWTARSAAEANSWRSICFSEALGLFCAVALDGTNRAMTSPDGITWTASAISSSLVYYGVTFSESLCLFCAVANLTSTVQTSTDGITWESETSVGGYAWRSICFSESLGLFCAVASSGANRAMTSPDGETWTGHTATEVNSWISVCYSESQQLFAAVAFNGTNRVMTSPDGETWTARSVDLNIWTSVTFGDISNDDARRDALERAWVPSTGQSPSRIQTELQANGFDVYVFDSFYWANELTDGDQEAVGTTAWFAVNSTLSKQTSSPYEGTQVMRCARDTQTYFSFRQLSIMTTGHKYWIKGVVRSDGVAVPRVTPLGQGVEWIGTNSTSWQHFLIQLDGTDTATDMTIDYGGSGASGYVEFDALEIFDLSLTLYRDPTDVIGPSVSGNPLVNKILRTEKIYTVEAGDDSAYSGENQEAGETHMEAGNYSGFRSIFDPYPIPTDSTKFPHFLYIGSEGFTAIDIDETRRGELEDLCLKLCPTEKWIGFIEELVDVWVYITTSSSGDLATDADLLAHLQATYGKGDTISSTDVATYLTANFDGSYFSFAVDTSEPTYPGTSGPHTLELASGETPVFVLARCQVIPQG